MGHAGASIRPHLTPPRWSILRRAPSGHPSFMWQKGWEGPALLGESQMSFSTRGWAPLSVLKPLRFVPQLPIYKSHAHDEDNSSLQELSVEGALWKVVSSLSLEIFTDNENLWQARWEPVGSAVDEILETKDLATFSEIPSNWKPWLLYKARGHYCWWNQSGSTTFTPSEFWGAAFTKRLAIHPDPEASVGYCLVCRGVGETMAWTPP